MQILHVVVDCLYKVMVNGYGNLCAVERGFHCVCILSRLCKEHELLDLSVEECGCGVFIACKRVVHRLERGLSKLCVGHLEQGNESALCYGVFLAAAVLYARKL